MNSAIALAAATHSSVARMNAPMVRVYAAAACCAMSCASVEKYAPSLEMASM